MKVTKENIKDINYIPEYYNIATGRSVLESLLDDIEDINNTLKHDGFENKQIYIDYENEHTVYSCERIEPCPDYYGFFRVKYIKSNQCIGDIMHLNELDDCLCLLYDFVNY